MGSCQPAPPPRREKTLPEWVPLGSLMALGLALRLTVTVWDPLLFPDSTEYLHLAREIKSREFFQPDYDLDRGFNQSRRRPPLYSALAALVPARTSPEHAAIAVSLALSMLSFIPFYFAARELSGKRSALLTTALFALHPFVLWYSSPALSEAAFTALYTLAFYAGTMALRRPRARWFIVSGAVSALLLMAKEVGVIAPAAIAAGAFIRRRALGTRAAAAGVMVMAAAFAVCAAPYLLNVRLRSGHWGLSAQMTTPGIAGLMLAGPGDAGRADRYPLRITGELPERGDAAGAARRAWSNLGGYGLALIRALGPAMFVLMLAGLAPGGKSEGPFLVAGWPLLWMAPMWMAYAAVSPFMVDARYMLPLVPIGIFLAATGTERLADMLAKGGGKGAGALFTAAGACALLAQPGLFREDLDILVTFAPPASRLAPIFIYLPAAAFAAAGALALTRFRPGAARFAAAGLAVAAGAALVPQYVSYRLQAGPESHYLLFGAGAREAAAELRAEGLVPSGRVIASAKPFLPYYLAGTWHIDRERHYSLPDTRAELGRMLAEGKSDYLALDTYSTRVLKPGLAPLALGMGQPPGTRLIYSRFFDQYQRIITVYDCRSAEPAAGPCADARECLAAARALYGRDRLVEADRELHRALARDPDLLAGWDLQLKIYDRYYQCIRRDDTPTLATVPELLPAWILAASEYHRLAPADPAIAGLILELQRTIARERSLLPGRD